MAQYQRFVAYVYEYSENKKGGNKGFVKVEARDGKCKMDFQMKGLGSRQNIPGNIYGFIRNKNENEQILLGTCNMAGDTVRFHAETREDNIMGSEYSLKQLAGIVVLTEGGTFYGTQWDDNIIETGQFRFLLEKTVEMPPQVPMEESVPPFEEEAPQEMAQPEEEAPQEPAQPEEEAPPEEETQQEPASPEEEAPPEEETQQEPASSEVSVEEEFQAEESISPPLMEEEVLSREMQPMEIEAASQFHQVDSQLEAKAVEEPEFAPFRDGFITNCKKITPSESGIMNNFILHGYRNYKHILKGQLQDTGQYIIGVPGFYEPQEKFMAGMFGFSNFKTAGYEEVTGQSVSNSRNGQQAPNYQFGYWYRVVSSR